MLENTINKYTIIHGNVKIRFSNEREVKDYIERFGRKKITVYESRIVFDRTAAHIKVDRL